MNQFLSQEIIFCHKKLILVTRNHFPLSSHPLVKLINSQVNPTKIFAWAYTFCGNLVARFPVNSPPCLLLLTCCIYTWFQIIDTWYVVTNTCYIIPVTRYLLSDTCYLILSNWYMLPATCYLIPVIWCLLPGIFTRYILMTRCLIFDTFYLIFQILAIKNPILKASYQKIVTKYLLLLFFSCEADLI